MICACGLETGADEDVAAELLGEQHGDAVDAVLHGEEPLEVVEPFVHVVVHPGNDTGDSEHEVFMVLVVLFLELLEALEGERFGHSVEVRE